MTRTKKKDSKPRDNVNTTTTKKKSKKPKLVEEQSLITSSIVRSVGDVGNCLYLGMDPGRNGASCLIDSGRNILFLRDNPRTGGKFDPKKFQAILKIYENYAAEHKKRILAAIEDPTFSPVWSRRTIYAFGTYYGMALGVLSASSYLISPVIRIPPRIWQKSYLQAKEKTSKDKSVKTAYELFENVPMDLDQGEDRGDRAEALLIANFILDKVRKFDL